MMTMMINDEDDKDSKVMIDPMVHLLECNVSRRGDHHDNDDYDNIDNDDMADIDNSGKDDDI